MAEDVYCTLLLNDSYLPGTQVLAHSLRDGGTTKRLAVMVALAGLKPETVVELKKLYDYVIPVDPIYNASPANLLLMDRLDLNAAFTKINLWKQTQFRKVVFVDADVLALRPPDELFDIDADFAACPDIGWPDCFNSGLMVVKPDLDTFNKLLDLARQGASFDGADQGLLNIHFKDWHRLSFNYNATPSSSYQYKPAYLHYGSQISMVHFIGADKPWLKGYVPGLPASEPYDELCAKWWAVWNQHYGQLTEQSFPWSNHGQGSVRQWGYFQQGNTMNSIASEGSGTLPNIGPDWQLGFANRRQGSRRLVAEIPPTRLPYKGPSFEDFTPGTEQEIELWPGIIETDLEPVESLPLQLSPRSFPDAAHELPAQHQSTFSGVIDEGAALDGQHDLTPRTVRPIQNIIDPIPTKDPGGSTEINVSSGGPSIQAVRAQAVPQENKFVPKRSIAQTTHDLNAAAEQHEQSTLSSAPRDESNITEPPDAHYSRGDQQSASPELSYLSERQLPELDNQNTVYPHALGSVHPTADQDPSVPRTIVEPDPPKNQTWSPKYAAGYEIQSDSMSQLPSGTYNNEINAISQDSVHQPHSPATSPPTHFEQYTSGGKIPEYVIARGEPVPQREYFQTGNQTHFIQKYLASGEPVSNPISVRQHQELPQPAETQEVCSKDAIELASQDSSVKTNRPVPFSAPQHDWDPRRSSPPPDSAPEARDLQIRAYRNEWDNTDPHNNTVFVAPEPTPIPKQHLWYDIPEQIPEPTSQKPIFPWEYKERAVTRVFAEESVSSSPQSSPPVSSSTSMPDEGEIMVAGDDDLDIWKTFSVQNEWDTNPEIRDYVSNMKRRRSHDPLSVHVSPHSSGVFSGEVNDPPSLPVTPNPIRRIVPPWLTDNDGGPKENEQWDPFVKLEELKRLPRSFIAAHMTSKMHSHATQTDDYNDGLLDRSRLYRPQYYSPDYKDTSTQTEVVTSEERGIQCDANELEQHEAGRTDEEGLDTLGVDTSEQAYIKHSPSPMSEAQFYSSSDHLAEMQLAGSADEKESGEKFKSSDNSLLYIKVVRENNGIDLRKIAGIPVGTNAPSNAGGKEDDGADLKRIADIPVGTNAPMNSGVREENAIDLRKIAGIPVGINAPGT